MQQGAVRHAAEDDLAAVADLEARAFPGLNYPYFALREMFDVHGHHMLVAGDPGVLHGYALLASGRNGQSWLLSLAVDLAHRRQGHGRRLLDAVLSLADDGGLGAVRLTVAPDNHPALRLYHESGFCLAERRRDYLGPGHDRLVMVRAAPGRP
ncbi:GNAT family N-acetyltransferase [Streptomyces sp. NBC_00433]